MAELLSAFHEGVYSMELGGYLVIRITAQTLRLKKKNKGIALHVTVTGYG